MNSTQKAGLLILIAGLAFLVSVYFNHVHAHSDAQQMRNEMLYPTVQVRNDFGEGGIGTGVIIKHDGEIATILTAAHVVDKPGKLSVVFVNENENFDADLVVMHRELDLAILQVERTEVSVAVVSDVDFVDRMERIYSVGSGHGYPIHMTEGFTSATTDLRQLITAPAIQGNSGGGVYWYEDGKYRLIGVLQAIASTSTKVYSPTPFGVQVSGFAAGTINHLAWMANIKTVKRFIARDPALWENETDYDAE